MYRLPRTIMLLLTTGTVWYGCMWLLFVISGAQRVLSDPAYQSSKFYKVFAEYEPLPRMVSDGSILWKGFFICGLIASVAFLAVNTYIKGSWVKRGLTFGFLHWALMTPWFEFYLPYNVMHEPLPLVLLEAGLWLVTLMINALYMSAIINFPLGTKIKA